MLAYWNFASNLSVQFILSIRGFDFQVYEHRVYRYLENPSEHLATIKDDEHIVAYRLPRREADLTRLEIWHRYQDT